MAGVVAYYDYKSIPGTNNIIPPKTIGRVVEELFCSGTVRYYHQPVGIVVATSQLIAQEAASKVKIFYTTPKNKPLLTIQDVLTAKATDRITVLTTVTATSKGQDTKQIIKGKFYMKQQYHFHMELQCCQVIPREDNLDMYPASQFLGFPQSSASYILNIPENK